MPRCGPKETTFYPLNDTFHTCEMGKISFPLEMKGREIHKNSRARDINFP